MVLITCSELGYSRDDYFIHRQDLSAIYAVWVQSRHGLVGVSVGVVGEFIGAHEGTLRRQADLQHSPLSECVTAWMYCLIKNLTLASFCKRCNE